MNTITIVERTNETITKVVQHADDFINGFSYGINTSNQPSSVSTGEVLNLQEDEDAAGYYYEMIAQQPQILNNYK